MADVISSVIAALFEHFSQKRLYHVTNISIFTIVPTDSAATPGSSQSQMRRSRRDCLSTVVAEERLVSTGSEPTIASSGLARRHRQSSETPTPGSKHTPPAAWCLSGKLSKQREFQQQLPVPSALVKDSLREICMTPSGKIFVAGALNTASIPSTMFTQLRSK